MDNCKNENGKTPLDLLFSSSDFLQKLSTSVRIAQLEDLKVLEKACDRAFGADSFEDRVLKQIGGQLLGSMKNLIPEVFKYLLKVKKLAVEQFVLQIYRAKYPMQWTDYDVLRYLIEAGASVIDVFYMCHTFCVSAFYLLLQNQLGQRLDHDKIFFEFMQHSDSPDRLVQFKFLKNQNIVVVLKGNKNYLRKFLPYFFVLCCNHADLEYLLDLGLDPKELVDSKILCHTFDSWFKPEMWQLLRDRPALTLEELEKINFIWDVNVCALPDADRISCTFMDKLKLEDECEYFFSRVYRR
jgi:hypothetical protein